jgi:trans-aconitate 2-methyltransferase
MARQAEWNAANYHLVSKPHEKWGASVLDRIPRTDIALAMDAGCGTGKITGGLLERLPDAKVVAVDYSPAMLAVAEKEYGPRYGERVSFRQVDLSTASAADFPERFDLIFSTATFHWIHDHQRLFHLLFDLLKPGGWLVAQCGGGPNLAEARAFAGKLMTGERFGHYFTRWVEPWIYENDGDTARQLEVAGFSDISAWLEEQPTDMGDADTYRDYVRTVIFREHLAAISNDADKVAFVEALVANAATANPPFVLDYWRLNMVAKRPD